MGFGTVVPGTDPADRGGMRFVGLLFILAACETSYGDLTITPQLDKPLGIGLAAYFQVHQELCDTGYDGDCSTVTPDAITVSAGLTVETSISGPSFQAYGVAEGGSYVTVTGNDEISSTMFISVAPVGSTTLSAQLGATEVLGPIQAFTQSELAITQKHVGDDGSVLAGEATLAIDTGTTQLGFAPGCDCYETRDATGTARLWDDHGSVEIDIVDIGAMVDYTVAGPTTFTAGAHNDLLLIPADASARPIVGLGPRPQLTIADPTVISVGVQADSGNTRSVTLVAHAAGTTTLDVEWGGIHKTITLHVA
jgi:hypothetical protein